MCDIDKQFNCVIQKVHLKCQCQFILLNRSFRIILFITILTNILTDKKTKKGKEKKRKHFIKYLKLFFFKNFCYLFFFFKARNFL